MVVAHMGSETNSNKGMAAVIMELQGPYTRPEVTTPACSDNSLKRMCSYLVLQLSGGSRFDGPHAQGHGEEDW